MRANMRASLLAKRRGVEAWSALDSDNLRITDVHSPEDRIGHIEFP